MVVVWTKPKFVRCGLTDRDLGSQPMSGAAGLAPRGHAAPSTSTPMLATRRYASPLPGHETAWVRRWLWLEDPAVGRG